MNCATSPSALMMSNSRVLMAAYMWGPAPLPLPMPASSSSQFSCPCEISESPKVIQMWCLRCDSVCIILQMADWCTYPAQTESHNNQHDPVITTFFIIWAKSCQCSGEMVKVIEEMFIKALNPPVLNFWLPYCSGANNFVLQQFSLWLAPTTCYCG